MVSVETFVPEGFVVGRHPVVGARLTALMSRLGPRMSPQRVAAVVKPGAEAAARALFAENPGWVAKRKAPGVFEVLLTVDDIVALSTRTDVVHWLDDASRLHGAVLEDASATAAVTIHGVDAKAARLGAQQAGAQIAGVAADGSMKGAIAAGKLGALLEVDAIEAIEVHALA